MRAMSNEPSMEEILSSIKRIIAEEDIPAPGNRAPRRASSAASRAAPPEAETVTSDFGDDDQILELTEALSGDADSVREKIATAKADTSAKTEPRPAKAARSRPAAAGASSTPSPDAPCAAAAPAVMSDLSAEAARESLVSLSRLLVRSDDGQSNTLEGLVREMLRPMLKEWLDTHLPEVVETMVKREIDRITGRV